MARFGSLADKFHRALRESEQGKEDDQPKYHNAQGNRGARPTEGNYQPNTGAIRKQQNRSASAGGRNRFPGDRPQRNENFRDHSASRWGRRNSERNLGNSDGGDVQHNGVENPERNTGARRKFPNGTRGQRKHVVYTENREDVKKPQIQTRNEAPVRGEQTEASNQAAHKKPAHLEKGEQRRRYPLNEVGNRNHQKPKDDHYKNKFQERRLMGFRRLTELSEKDPSEVIAVLANKKIGFGELLQTDLKPDWITLIMKILANVCKSTFQENKTAILSEACCAAFVDQLQKYIISLPQERHHMRKQEIPEFLDNTLKFCQNVIDHLPLTACEMLGNFLVFCTMAIDGIRTFNVSVIDDSVKVQFMSLHSYLDEFVAKEKREKERRSKTDEMDVLLPPNDFRDIDIFPSRDDILSTEQVFIRRNIVKGCYSDVDHYLDVQFRLLREDFVGPLREGIRDFIDNIGAENSDYKKVKTVKIYREVKFLQPQAVKSKVGYAVHFDPKRKLARVKWEYSRRLLFGSLLCFSNDNFQTVFFGTVLDRELQNLNKGIILVELYQQANLKALNDDFVMVESNAYFEPYKHVLTALQHMTIDHFPMQQYIVGAQSEATPPRYLRERLVPIYEIDTYNVRVFEPDAWPSAAQLGLDPSQYAAFKSAITKEFVVIQGPPGTGKTYLGLKIAEVLHKNVSMLKRDDPILVVCFTNHALDQFLEGMVGFTQNMVRVGGRSRSETMEAYNLKERRKHVARNGPHFAALRDIRYRIGDCLTQIKTIQKSLEEIDENKGIIMLGTLKAMKVISDEQYGSLMKGKEDEICLVEWLHNTESDYDIDAAKFRNGTAASDQNPEPQEQAVEDDVLLEEEDEEAADRLEEDALFDFHDLAFEMQDGLLVGRLQVGFEITFNQLLREIGRVKTQLDLLQDEVDKDAVYTQVWSLEDKLYGLQFKCAFFQDKLAQGIQINENAVRRLLLQRDLWRLSPDERWNLYLYWTLRLKGVFQAKLRRLEEQYQTEWRQYIELQHMEDLGVLKQSKIVGMTTTGAARLQTMLQALKPSIVIVEEAAEVLESHIVVSLTSHCQHLILIGDHKQLRPSTAVFKLAKDFKMDISLFERMINNGMNCDQLKVQHRMRPQIAQLIVPSIYPVLENHESVLNFDEILGVTKNLFFVTHEFLEEPVEDTSSRQNLHEAEFMMAFCRHLILQGYETSKITILAAYSGQMFLMKSLRKKNPSLEGVRIIVVDNFQGEENDIILLSLVRNNEEGRIGFLSIENRVCVALSRARKGFYIIGSMNMLVRESKLWQKINETLEAQNAVGTHLTLKCQVHQTTFTNVATAEDFRKKSPEGGCLKICDEMLQCGHKCKWACHVVNRQHNNYKCFEKCGKIMCELEHICEKNCHQPCGKCMVPLRKKLPCQHVTTLPCHVDPYTYECRELVEKQIPHCEHKIMMPCFEDPRSYPCSVPCEFRLPCGHSCENNCHVQDDPDHLNYKCLKPCARSNAKCQENHRCRKSCWEQCGMCTFKVKKVRSCGHRHEVQCSVNPENIVCTRKCDRIMACGHKCRLKCNENCVRCPVKVTKVIPDCGHSIELMCFLEPKRGDCREVCERTLKCGHKCGKPCRDPCTEQCKEMVPSSVRPLCGHGVEVFCHEVSSGLSPNSDALLDHCRVPCHKQLECEHLCQGTCGKCLQGRIHQPCKEKCGRTLICGHSCNVPCAKVCPPCNRKCEYRCRHYNGRKRCRDRKCKQPSPCQHEYRIIRCPRKCGQPCVECKEKCEWKCNHHECTKFCYEQCDRPPCNEPCKKKLRCKHDCVGFCGEPCPPLCRVCDNEELTEILFGDEDEEGARFVYLEDCGHTIEANGLEQWLQQAGEGDQEITMKRCPKCKTIITRNFRYGNIIKTGYSDLHKIKRKIFGEMRRIEEKEKELQRMLVDIPQDTGSTLIHATAIDVLTSYCGVGKKIPLHDYLSIQTFVVRCSILTKLSELMEETRPKLTSGNEIKLSCHVNKILKTMNQHQPHISAQELDDFNQELKRLQRISQLYIIQSQPNFIGACSDFRIKRRYEECKDLIFSIRRYYNDDRVSRLIQDLARDVQTVISEQEKQMVVQAMSATEGAGHWFKCPNGHFYVIGDCGGAEVTSRCNECNALIGGGSHRLLDTNRFAGPEMDGATRPAWPGTDMNLQ